MTTINANTLVVGEITPSIGNGSLLYLENKDNKLTEKQVAIQKLYRAEGNRFGDKSVQLNVILEENEKLPLKELSQLGHFSGFLLKVNSDCTKFGYAGSNNTGDGTFALFYDANQHFIRKENIPTPPEGSDARYHYVGSFSIDGNVRFILFGGYDASFEVEEITLE